MSPRRRDAVWVFTDQIGRRTRINAAVSTSASGICPMTGEAQVESVLDHWAACFAFRQLARWASM
jgi:hypothetical protein